MKKFIRRFLHVFRSGEAIDELIDEKNKSIEIAKLIADKDRLDLCYKHRQEKNHSHFSECNCHYCNLEKRYLTLRKSIGK